MRILITQILNIKKKNNNEYLINYKSYIDDNYIIKNFFKFHVSNNKTTLILIGIRGIDDVFVSLNNEELWKNKVKQFYKEK